MLVYAKSAPLESPQTLWEHSDEVAKNSLSLKEIHNIDFLKHGKEHFWDALYLACRCHDLGKLNSRFQYDICRNINNSRKKNNVKKPDIDITELKSKMQKIPNIPHNILSPAFMLSEIERFPKEIQACICKAVAHHHNRGLDYLTNMRWHQVRTAIHTDLKPLDTMQELREFFGRPVIIGNKYRRFVTEDISQDYLDFYVLLKGLLHRADHAASAGVSISIDDPKYNKEKIKNHICSIAKRPADAWQIQTLKNISDGNIIMQAGTGMGKTEFALCWAADSKTFYTLPLRTSTNAIYERIRKIFDLDATSVGLLHSTTREYFFSKDESMLPSTETISSIRQMSMPISVSTADQIFTSVFRYPGYEKIYAAMANSKIVVDELQAYNPEIIAVILRGLVDYERLGAKFCIITATLPQFCTTYLEEKTSNSIARPEPLYRDIPRHKIKLIDQALDGHTIQDIIRFEKAQKVLVILNTVSAAIAMKHTLDDLGVSSNLLHSRFTYEDRHVKENHNSKGILHADKGIWITTQVVEASVDIDFDVLITEISTMDSQIQRWGRIWRKRDRGPYKGQNPNIYISKDSSEKGGIYDSEIVEKTIGILEANSEKTVSDKDAAGMFHDVFSNRSLEGTKYLSSFAKSVEMLDELDFEADNKQQAQRLFRDINNISIIPKPVYDKCKEEFDGLIEGINSDDKKKRLQSILNIRKKTVSVPYNWNLKLETIDDRYNIVVGNVKYTSAFGAEKP